MRRTTARLSPETVIRPRSRRNASVRGTSARVQACPSRRPYKFESAVRRAARVEAAPRAACASFARLARGSAVGVVSPAVERMRHPLAVQDHRALLRRGVMQAQAARGRDPNLSLELPPAPSGREKSGAR